MPFRRLIERTADIFVAFRKTGKTHATPSRESLTHVVILDGTMSSLAAGCETNAGLARKLIEDSGAATSIYYEPGVQWRDWRGMLDVLLGRGINRQIRRAYGYLASRYRPGDRIFLFGYSRGAYAVRSLAGMIDMVGLLRPEEANIRNIRIAYRHYQGNPNGPYALQFRQRCCHQAVEIRMVGVWDTVKALGLRLPLLWRLAEIRHGFHSHHLGQSVKNGFHALALDENRVAYEPVLWDCPPDWPARIEQVWFRGSHRDIGGQLGGYDQARPLANIPFVWMLEQAETCGLSLPNGWHSRYPQDASAPSIGNWRGGAWIFLLRRPRVPGRDRSERLHESIKHEMPGFGHAPEPANPPHDS